MRRHGPVAYSVAGGLSAASNVIVFQLLLLFRGAAGLHSLYLPARPGLRCLFAGLLSPVCLT